MTTEQLIARCALLASEGAYHAALRRKVAYSAKYRAWVRAKALCAALGV